MNRIVRSLATLNDNCPQGGNHTPGTSGEWVGRCTKCGQSC
jgi:hypothetical protein